MMPERAARGAAQMLISLAQRACAAEHEDGSIPQCVLQQRWSPLNVPLMWAAASDSSLEHPVIEWLQRIGTTAGNVQTTDGTFLPVNALLAEGLMALRRRFREWNIQISSGLVAWAHESNYRSVQLLGYLHWQCQEYVLGRVG